MSSHPHLFTVIAFIAAAILCPVVSRLALFTGNLDQPNERSSHSRPTPRNGGVALFAACALSMAAGNVLASFAFTDLLALLLGTSILGLLGFVDDVRGLDYKTRFVIQGLVAAAWLTNLLRVSSSELVVLREFSLQPTSVLVLLPLFIWLVGFTNAFNFMDGVNGMAAGQTAVSASIFGALAQGEGDAALAAAMFAVTGAALGFLLWNASGVLFLGDVGSTSLGFLFAASAIRLATSGVSFLLLLLPLSPFIMDTSVTLLRRIVRGERWYSAHRSHFYQRLNHIGLSHLAVSALWTAFAVSGGAIALFLSNSPYLLSIIGAFTGLQIVVGLAITMLEARKRTGRSGLE